MSIICWPKGVVRATSVGFTFDSLKMALGFSFEMWPKNCQETSVPARKGFSYVVDNIGKIWRIFGAQPYMPKLIVDDSTINSG